MPDESWPDCTCDYECVGRVDDTDCPAHGRRDNPRPGGRPTMTDDIIVLVPPGTRVHYIENPHTDGKVLVVDAHALRPYDPVASVFALGPPPYTFGLPVYAAETLVTKEIQAVLDAAVDMDPCNLADVMAVVLAAEAYSYSRDTA